MNEKNFEYLRNQLKYTGFGNELSTELKEKMHKGTPEFTLYHQSSMGKDHIAAALYFKRMQEGELYFFNRYQLALKKEGAAEALKETFYLSNKGGNISLKEAYNLLSGRAVHKELLNKEGQKYQAWLQLDFKQTDLNGNYKLKTFHENYGYDLEKTLARYPIKELTNEQQRQALMHALQKGNRASANLTHDGKEQNIFLEAVPKFKALHLFDDKGLRIKPEAFQQKKGQSQSEPHNSKKTAKQQSTAKNEIGNIAKPKRSKRQKRTIS